MTEISAAITTFFVPQPSIFKVFCIFADEMLQALMEDVAKAARKSSAKAEAEKKKRMQTVAREIAKWKSTIAV